MNRLERRVFAGVLLLAAILVSRGSPAMSGDAPYLLAGSYSLLHDRDLDLRNQYDEGGDFPFRAEAGLSSAMPGRNGALYPSQGLALSIALTPVLLVAESVADVLPAAVLDRVRWNRTRAVRDLISLAMAALTAWLAVLTIRMTRRLVDPPGGTAAVALAFLAPPLLFASILPVTEIPAAVLIAWFVLEQTSASPRPVRAAAALALLPWLNARYLLVAIAGFVWLIRSRPPGRSRRPAPALWLPVMSIAGFVALSWWLFGTALPAVVDGPVAQSSVLTWLIDLPAPLLNRDNGLLWIAPFWLIALAGAGGPMAGRQSSRFAWIAAGGLLLAAVVGRDHRSDAPGMAMAPVLPVLVPAVAVGLRRLTSRAGRFWTYTAVAWTLAMTVIVVHAPRRILAAPGSGLGQTPERVVQWAAHLNAPEAKLERLGLARTGEAFIDEVRAGHVDNVELFIRAGASPSDGLVEAEEHDQLAMLQLLLARAPSLGVQAARALAYARSAGRQPMVEALTAAGASLDSTDASGETALVASISQERPDELALLLRLGANVNAATRTGMTALITAIAKGDDAAVADLIAAGADVNQADNDGWTPLITAVRNGRDAAVGALLAAGADPNRTSRLGWTALMWAAHDGRTDFVTRLAAAAADLDASSAAGQTALIRAAGEGHLETVKVLLAAGANPAIRADDGTAAEWARRNGHAAVADVLARAAGGRQ